MPNPTGFDTTVADVQIRLRVFFPLAPTGRVDLTDRTDIANAEVRVLDWGELVQSMDASRDSWACTIFNGKLPTTQLGTDTRFSDYWNSARPPEGTPCEIHFRLSPTAAWETLFTGAIQEISEVSERAVQLEIGDPGARLYREIGDPILRSDYPQAAEAALAGIKPIVLGAVAAWTPPKVRERKKTVLQTTLTASTAMPAIVSVEDSETWPTTGQLRIDEEDFAFDQATITSTTQIRLTARAQNGTTAAAHDSGAAIAELAQEKWLVCGHKATTLGDVFGVTSKNDLVLIDPSLYTADTGALSGEASIELVETGGLSVAAPSDSPTYRRYELDSDINPTLADVPAGFSTNNQQAKNAVLAAADAGSWTGNSYALLRKNDADTLLLTRTAAISDPPPTAPTAVFLAVEHWGIETFGALGTLEAEVSALGTTLAVTFGAIDDFVANQTYVIVDDELMRVSAATSGQLTVLRGQLGTAASEHGEGAVVRLARHPSTAADGRVVLPQAHVFVDTGAGPVEVGKLRTLSDVPPKIAAAEGYTEASTLEAWHGHQLAGLPISGRGVQRYDFFDSAIGWTFGGARSDLMPATLLPFSAGTVDGPTIPDSFDAAAYYQLGTTGLAYCLDIDQSQQFSVNQRVAVLRIRAMASHATSGNLRCRVWIGSNGDASGVATNVFDQTVSVTSSISANSPTDQFVFKVDFSANNGFPNGVRMAQLLNKHFQVLFTGTNTRLHYASADFKMETAQLVGGAGNDEYLANRAVSTHEPTLVVSSTASPYTNAGLPGPFGSAAAPATNFGATSIVVHLLYNRAWFNLTKSSGNAFIVRDNGGNTELTRWSTDGTNKYEIRSASFNVGNAEHHGTARIFRLSLLMQVAGRNIALAPSVSLQGTNVPFSTPSSESAGGWSNVDGDTDNLSRRVWRWTWNFVGVGVVAKDLRQWFVKIDANGTVATGTEFYADNVVFHIEAEEPKAKKVIPEKASNFTAVNYFDASAVIGTYSDVVGAKVAVRMARNVFDPDLKTTWIDGSFQPQQVVTKDERFRPIFVHRVWWVFEYAATNTEEVSRIAVDVTGFPLPFANGTSAIGQVLVGGPPLLSATLAEINSASFASAAAAGALNLRGVIDRRVDAHALLQELCLQAQLAGFWEGNGQFRLVYKQKQNDMPGFRATFDHNAGEILEDSLRIEQRPKNTIDTRVIVRAAPDYVKGELTIDAGKVAPLAETNLGVIHGPREIAANYLWTETDAGKLASQQLDYSRTAERVVRFAVPPLPKSIALRRGDIIGIRNHPLLGNVNRLQVVAKHTLFGSLRSGIPTIEIECLQRELGTDEADL